MKNTRRSLITSLVTLLLCSAMFVGSSFAWFTDTVSNTGNRIQAGTLKVDLLMDKGEDYVSIANGTGDIFKEAAKAQNSNETLWEPGKTQFAKLAVENKGNLALKYIAYIDVIDNGLAGSLEYAIVSSKDNISTTATNWEEVKAAITAAGGAVGDVATGRNEINTGVLDEIVKGTQNERDYVLLAVHMKETAGNEYQGKDAIIDVIIAATQFTAEEDGFGSDQYDTRAQFPAVAAFEPVSEEDVNSESTKTLKVENKGAVKEAEVKAKDVKPVFEDFKEKIGAVDGDSNTLTLTLNVDKVSEDVKDIEAGKEYTTNLDISMEGTMITIKGADGTKVIKTEDVKSLDGFVTIKLDLGGVEYDEVAVKHNGADMQELSDADATPSTDYATVGGFYFDSANKVVIVKTKTFSPFAIIGTKSNMPKKGTLIKMDLVPTETTIYPVDSCPIGDDGKETYRILKTEGTQALVLAMYDSKTSINMYDSESNIQTEFDNGAKYLRYNGSLVDIELNTTFYGKLTDDAKGAIVPTIIKQGAYSKIEEDTSGAFKYDYYYSNNTKVDKNSTNRETEVTIGERNVFALDMEDVFSYLDNEATIDKIINMYYNENFNNARSNDANFVWLRSAGTNFSKYEWSLIYGNYFSGLNTSGYNYASFGNSISARPSFYIDLTKIDWAKAE